MKLCFPVEENAGLDSQVYGHFGSAPTFLVVDTDSHEIFELKNSERSAPCCACATVRELGRQQVDVLLVGAIGASALKKLCRVGLKVYQARSMKIAENLAWFSQEQLSELRPGQGLGIHGHGHSLGECCG